MLNASNNASSLLVATINSSVTSLEVASASTFPVFPFMITIDNEILEVTNVVGAVFTVTRGAEGSTATSHTAGVDVEHRWTAGMYTDIVLELAEMGDRLYTENNVVVDGQTLTESIDALDVEIALKTDQADFTNSLGVTGWRKTPDGLIEQWGVVTGVTNAGAAVTFPMAFPTAVYILQATPISPNIPAVSCPALSVTGASLFVDQADATSVMYRVIGV